jgi:hypothetical protein
MTYSEVTEKTIGSRSVSPSAAPDAGLILAEGQQSLKIFGDI